MSVCGNCLRWLRHLKRGSGHGPSEYGTCWLDGMRTTGNSTCGFHSDDYPIRDDEPTPPRDDDPSRGQKMKARKRSRGVNTGGWTR